MTSFAHLLCSPVFKKIKGQSAAIIHSGVAHPRRVDQRLGIVEHIYSRIRLFVSKTAACIALLARLSAATMNQTHLRWHRELYRTYTVAPVLCPLARPSPPCLFPVSRSRPPRRRIPSRAGAQSHPHCTRSSQRQTRSPQAGSLPHALEHPLQVSDIVVSEP